MEAGLSMRQLLRIYHSQIKYKIILPYLLLMILVMLVGAGIAIFLVAGSLQERFSNQLGQVGRSFADGLARQEQNNLDFLYVVAFAQENPEVDAPAVAEAFQAENEAGLEQALEPFFRTGTLRDNIYNVMIDRLIAFDLDGQALVHWERAQGEELTEAERREPISHGNTDLSQLDPVQRVLANNADDFGDKYAALITFQEADAPEGTFPDDDYYLFTVVPVHQIDADTDERELVGGLLIATRLENLLTALERQSQSEVSAIYDTSGLVLDSTVIPNVGLHVLDMDETIPQQLVDQFETAEEYARCFDETQTSLGWLPGRTDQLACSILDEVNFNERGFQFLYAPLIVRDTQVGYFSIGLSEDYVTAPWAESRNVVILTTLLLAVGAVLIGYRVARQITNPLDDLVTTARAVTHGQLERRTNVIEHNEFGTLAQAFNQMTEHLLHLYTTSRELNNALEIRQVLDVAAASASSFVPDTEVLALLREEDTWFYHTRSAAAEPLQQLHQQQFPANPVLVRTLEQQSNIRILHTNTADAQEQPLVEELHRVTALNTLLIAPLLLHNRQTGVLILGHADVQAFGEAEEQVLAAVANMSVTVLQNAILYMRVQKDATERHAILTSIGDGVIVCDTEGTIMLANPIAEQLLELKNWRTHRRNFADLSLEPVAQARDIFGQASSNPHYRIGDRVVSRTNAPVIAEQGHVLGEVIVLHDITAEVAVDQAKTDFIATISHELRTPLTVIRGYIDLLMRGTGGELSADQAELLDSVRSRATDMTTLVNNVIMIANIESGTLSTEIQPQDPLMVLEMALNPLRSGFASKGLELQIADTATDVPQVLADREQLKVMFTQLLDNALRYTTSGSVTIKPYLQNNMVRIDFIDTGPGIDPDIQRRLFNRFQRVEGNNSAQRGGGLGLAITRQLVERQGGRVWVESTPGQGSTFSIALPKADEQSLAVAQQETAAAS
jgi:signal transduction histidine kinase